MALFGSLSEDARQRVRVVIAATLIFFATVAVIELYDKLSRLP